MPEGALTSFTVCDAYGYAACQAIRFSDNLVVAYFFGHPVENMSL